MGKIDDMRRQREQQYAGAGKPAQPAAEKATSSLSKSGEAVDEHGKCPECGKTKPVQNGLMASHQKGFGKACAGSRKPPA